LNRFKENQGDCYELPYEKCEKYGQKCLSDTELLAVLLRTGTKEKDVLALARELLYEGKKDEKGLLSLHYLTMKDLQKINGIGRVKAIQILCLSEISKRLAKSTRREHFKYTTPESVAEFYMEDLRHETRENVKVVFLDSRFGIINDLVISKGSINSSAISPREIFIEALNYNAVNFIILHNHPSGDPSPSKSDVVLTKKIESSGKMLGIKLLDHIIIGDNKYYSFLEKNEISY
jgi:DNA repair protein RadC